MSGKFSLQWVNHTDFKRPMCSVRFNLRDALSQTGDGGLTCSRLHLDQVHIQFRPNGEAGQPTAIQDSEYRLNDDRSKDWLAETLQLYVRVSPGERHTLYTSGRPVEDVDPSSVPHPQRSLVYSVALGAAHNTGFDLGGDAYCRSYRPLRDLPVLQNVMHLSEIQVDLLWPLLQGDPSAAWWSVPDYRILRVLCEFSYTS
jgi:hypothetical protein